MSLSCYYVLEGDYKEYPEKTWYGTEKIRGGGENDVTIDPQSLTLEKHFFDKGSTSRVYKGTFTERSGQSKTICAKEFLVSLRGRYKIKVKKEIELITSLNHLNILTHYGIDFDRSILVTEYVEKIIQFEDNEERIHNTRQLLDIREEDVPWSLRISIATQAAEGLCYLHNQGIIHADIKAGNVFLSGGRDDEKWLVKLGDFGESLFEFMQFTSTQASSMQGTPNKKGTRRATTAFLAPERADPTQKPSTASDIYAFSMFLVELTLPKRIHPYDGDLPPNSNLVECAGRGLRPTLPENVNELSSEVFKLWTDVVCKAWSQRPETRPNSHVLLKHLKEIRTSADAFYSESNKDVGFSYDFVQSEIVADEVVPLDVHQGTAAEVLSEMVADSINSTGNVTPKFQREIDRALRSTDGTNSCVFLSILILDKLKSVISDSCIDISKIKTIAEEEIKTAPTLLNPFRDVDKLMAVDEVLTLFKENNITTHEYALEERLLGRTSSNNYLESVATLETALHQLSVGAPSFTIYTQTPVSFGVLAFDHQIVVIDTHRIGESLGGNGNGAVMVFRRNNQLEKHSFCKRASNWILKRMCKSLEIPPQSLVVLKEISTHSSSSALVKQEDIDTDSVGELTFIPWDDDEDLLKAVEMSTENFGKACAREVQTFSDKFVDIPTTARDVTIQGHATKLGIMKLKDFQLRAVKAVLDGRDCLIVQSTASGKSACFQLPSVILNEGCFVLVISPTVSLMESQVYSMTKLGVHAVFLGAASSSDWNFSNLDDADIDESIVPKIVYVTPEYLIGDDKRPGAYLRLPAERIGLIVVDECHKIFERSGNFRYVHGVPILISFLFNRRLGGGYHN